MTDDQWIDARAAEYQALIAKGMPKVKAARRVRETFEALRIAEARAAASKCQPVAA